MASTYTLTGTLQDATGQPVTEATVTVTPASAHGQTLRVDNAIVIPTPVSVTTDGDGRFTVSLLPRTAYEPSGVLYTVQWLEPVTVAGRVVRQTQRRRLISMPAQNADLADESVQVTIGEDDDGQTVVEVPQIVDTYDEIDGAPPTDEAWPTPPAYDDVSGAPSTDDPWPGGGGGSGGSVAYADITGAPALDTAWPTPPAYTDVTGAPDSSTAWPTPPAYDDVSDAPDTSSVWPTAPAYTDITGAPATNTAWPTPPAYTDITGTPSIPTRSTATPINTGTASAGTSTDYAAGDHDHGIITSGGTSIDPSDSTPVNTPGGSPVAGDSVEYARGDHDHAVGADIPAWTSTQAWPQGSLAIYGGSLYIAAGNVASGITTNPLNSALWRGFLRIRRPDERPTPAPLTTTGFRGSGNEGSPANHAHPTTGLALASDIPQVTVLLPQSLTVDSTETLQVGPAAYRSEMPVTASTTIPVTALGTGSLASNLDTAAHTFTLAAGAYLLFVHLNQVWNTDEDANALRNRSTIAASVTGTLPAGSFHTPVPHYFRGAVDDNPAQAATQEYLYLPEDTTVGIALVGYPGIGEDTNSTARNTSYRCTVDQVVLMPLAGVTVS